MSNKIENLPELFITLFFAGAVLQILTEFSKFPDNKNLEWIFASTIVLIISILIISLIFKMKLDITIELISELIFICAIVMTIFSFLRLLHSELKEQIWVILMIFLFFDSLALIFVGSQQDKKEKRNYCYIFASVIIVFAVVFYFLTKLIIYGGFL